MSVKRRWLIGDLETYEVNRVRAPEGAVESAPPPESSYEEASEAACLGPTARLRRRHAEALVRSWRAGDVKAGQRINRMLEDGDGETRIALVEALPNTVPFEVIEAALKGMGRSCVGGSAQKERLGWTVVTALLAGGLFLDLCFFLSAARFLDPGFFTLSVFLATSPGLVAWMAMIVHRRIQSVIDDARQKYYYARIAVIAKASLRRDPSQYAQPLLTRLQEVAPVVDLEGGTTKKVYRQTVRIFEDAVEHLRSLPVAADAPTLGPESLPVPSCGDADPKGAEHA